MIIFNKEKYEGIAAEDNAGIVGENLVSKVEFTVNDFVGKNTIAAIHLRFKDGSVNTVAPQTVKTVNNSTYIMWKIGKNDIFCHGWVEVQLELREEETTLQTDIVRLFAGESIPIEDKGFTNPNSETLALRDEAKKCWDKIAEQNKQIENNIKVIADSDITLKEEKANKVTLKADVTEESYPSVAYLENYYYDYDDVDDEIQKLKSSVDTKLNLKADKADTLAGYGITDAYNKTYLDKALRDKLNKMPFDTVPAANSPNYVTSGTLYNSVNTLNQSIEKKADLIATYNVFDFNSWAKGLQELTTPVYSGTLNNVDYNEKSISLTTTKSGAYTNGWTSSAPQSMRIAVKPSTKYIVSWLPSSTNCGAYVFLNGINTTATRFELKEGSGSFTTAEDTTYILIRFDYYGTGAFKVSKIMISESESIYLPNKVAEGVLDVANEVSAFEKTTQTDLATKYDSSNFESGSGELSPANTNYEGCAGKFVYTKNGDAVTVSVNITSMLADKNYLQMSGLPFPSKTESKLASIAVYSTKNKLRNVKIEGSWISISSPSDNFAEGEKMNFIITYIIRR